MARRDDSFCGPAASRATPDEQGIGAVLTRRLGAEVQAMLRVSEVVAIGGPLRVILDEIAGEAANILNGSAASVLLRRGDDFYFAGVHGLSERYVALSSRTDAIAAFWPSRQALAMERTFVIDDTETDDPRAGRREAARQEGFRSLAVTPLGIDGLIFGTLTIYRVAAGSWPHDELALIGFFAQHASSAVRTAQLLHQQGEQLRALRRLVRGLRGQAHEHANRIHAIEGLLAMGNVAEAQRFVDELLTAVHAAGDAATSELEQATLKGLLLAEGNIARQRGIALEIDPRSDLKTLPPGMTDSQAVTVLGNLLDNACDAVADMPAGRRRIWVSLRQRPTSVLLVVRDWGPGFPSPAHESSFRPGETTKDHHEGLGLFLVREAVEAAFGRIAVQSSPRGTTIRITLPDAQRNA